ncbi:hypothetical protein [Luteimonas sp. e5]
MPHPAFPLRTMARAALLALLCLPGSALAEYVWLQPGKGNTVEVRYGDLTLGGHDHAGHAHAKADAGPFRIEHILPDPSIDTPGGQAATMQRQGEIGVIEGATGDLRLVQRALGQGKTIAVSYEARIGRRDTRARNPLEFVPIAPDSDSFVLLLNGQPSVNAPVKLESESGWSRWYRTDAQGRFTIETPWPGLYVLSVGRREQVAGEVDGRPYRALQHAASLSFVVPPEQARGSIRQPAGK